MLYNIHYGYFKLFHIRPTLLSLLKYIQNKKKIFIMTSTLDSKKIKIEKKGHSIPFGRTLLEEARLVQKNIRLPVNIVIFPGYEGIFQNLRSISPITVHKLQRLLSEDI